MICYVDTYTNRVNSNCIFPDYCVITIEVGTHLSGRLTMKHVRIATKSYIYMRVCYVGDRRFFCL